jgi:hypothetical protein
MTVTRSDDNPKLLISFILREFEFQVACNNHDLGISESFDGICTNRCSVFFEEKRQITADASFEINGDHLPDVTIPDQIGNREYVLLNTGVVSFSPTTPLNFKKQKHGTTSAPQTVKLTNTSKTELKISSMKAVGQFGMSSTCGTSVAAGADCAISVTFSPQTQGAKSGAITIKRQRVIQAAGDRTLGHRDLNEQSSIRST